LAHDLAARTAAALACAALFASLAGCSGEAGKDASKPPSMLGDVAAFEATPNDATYERIHADILAGALTSDAESRLVNRLLAGAMPVQVANAVAADLAAIDFLGTMRYLRQLNIASRVNPPPDGPRLTEKSSRLCWLLLALRPYGDKTDLDLTGMDLRSSNPTASQGMNLTNADFSNSRLPDGVWRNADLSGTVFEAATGLLTCENCSWSSARATLRLSAGRWVIP
jgi:Pentapeptide repeats (8 copies)